MDKLDVKLWSLAAKGQIVPDRSLLKTPEQIAAIRKSADLNTAVLDHVAAHIHAGMSTAEIDKLVYDFTTAGNVPSSFVSFPKETCIGTNLIPYSFATSSVIPEPVSAKITILLILNNSPSSLSHSFYYYI